MKIQSSQRNAAALIQTVDRKSAEVLSKDNTPYDRDFTPGSVELDRVVLQNDTSGYSEIVYGKVDQLKADIAY